MKRILLCAIAILGLTVFSFGQAPFANDDNGPALAEDGPNGTVNILTNDTDPDGNPTAPVNGVGQFVIDMDPGTAGIQTTFTDAQGIWTINTTTGVVTFDAVANYNGTAVIPYTLCDPTGICDPANITFVVNPLNDPPIANDDNGPALTEDGPNGTVNVIANDTDPDGMPAPPVNGGGNYFIDLDLSDWAIQTTFVDAQGSWSLDNSTGIVTFDPAVNYNGTAVISYRLSDSFGGSGFGNITFVVTPVNDPPVANCQNISGYLNAAGAFNIAPAYINNGSTDDNGIVSMTLTSNSFSCANIGPNNVTLTVFDAQGLSSNCIGVVTILDSIRPSITCPTNISQLIVGAAVVYSPVVASDNCSSPPTITQTAGLPSGSVFPVGTTTNTFVATDGVGNNSTCSFSVTVGDTIKPVAICKNFNVILGNVSGTMVITAPMVNNGSTDNSGSIASMNVTPNILSCANLGPNNVTLTVIDGSGNSSFCNSIITVSDTARPTITACPGAQTIIAGAGCLGVVPDYTGLVTATDNCTVATITQISPTPGSTISLGSTVPVTVRVTDNSGNSRDCLFSLTVTGPEINVIGNSISIVDGDITPTSTDYTDFGSTLVCSGTINRLFTLQNTGNTPLWLGGFSSITITGANAGDFTVIGFPPTSIAAGGSGGFMIQFNPSATGLRTATINIANDDCDENPYSFSVSGYGYELDIDLLGNSILIANNDIEPSLTDHTDFGSQTACLRTILRTFLINNNSTPGNGVSGISVNISGANASDFIVTANPSPNITWAMQTTSFTVMFDPSAPGLRTATINVTSNDCDENPYTFAISGFSDGSLVNDSEVNVKGNNQSIANGDGTPTTSDHTDFGSVLECGGTIARTFTIENIGNVALSIGAITITGAQAADFTVTTAPATSVAPAASTTFQVAFDPNATGLRSAIINIANNDCDENPYSFAVSGYGYESDIDLLGNSILIANNDVTPSLTDHTDFGTQTVCLGIVSRTFTIDNNSTPGNGVSGISVNISGANASDFIVTANPSPNITWAMQTTSFTVMFDPSAPGLRTATINVTSNDCDENPYTFAISGFGDDPEVNVKGNGQNIADGDMSPSTVDHTDFGSVLTCNGNMIRTFTVENTGNSTLTLGAINVTGVNASDFSLYATTLGWTIAPGGSGIIQIIFDPTSTGLRTAIIGFGNDDCDENPYNFAVQGTGNADLVNPIASCQNLTAYLNTAGTVIVDLLTQLNNGSTDNCGITSYSWDINGDGVYEVSSTNANYTFTCAHLGTRTVSMRVRDASSNTSHCNSIITILDTIHPITNCNNLSLYLNPSGTAIVIPAMLNNGSTDNCGIASMSVSSTSFNCSNIGPNNVTLTVTDASGNSSVCTGVVTVLDSVRPIANCKNISVYLNASGNANITGAMVNNGSTDACGIASLDVSPSSFTCANVGPNTVTLTVTDVNGRISTCNSIVTVIDTVSPVVSCSNITIYFPPAGNATIIPMQIDNGSTDACGIASMSVSPWAYSCANVGPNNVTLTVTDVNGNVSTCTSVLTLIDTIHPVANCQNVTVSLSGGIATVDASAVNNGSSDQCGIASMSVSPNTFDCNNLGPNTVTFTVVDNNGNSSSCSAVVNVLSDFTSAITVDNNVSCNGGSNGQATISTIGGAGSNTYLWEPLGGTGAISTGLTEGTYTCTATDAGGCTTSQTVIITEPTALVASATSQTNILCNGESTTILVEGTGGTTPYTGTETFTVTAGTYSYTVTDANGCANTTSITVTEPTMLSINVTATTILCNGGNAEVTVVGAGGTAPYTGEGSFTVTAGTYSYTVSDANGCSNTTSISITEPSAISTSVSVVDVDCNGNSTGSIDLTVSGGTGPYTFDWNSGIYITEDLNGLVAGTYVGLLTDANGCTDGGTITITEPGVLVADITTASNPTACGGTEGSLDITVSGGTVGYTFDWNSGMYITEDLANIGNGVYSCLVTDINGCTANVAANLNDPNPPSVTLTLTTDTVCVDDAAFTLTGESPMGGIFSGDGVTSGSFNPTAAGVGVHTISYTFTDVNGCVGSSIDSMYVDVCVGIQEASLLSQLSIFPNPNNGTFTLQLNSTAVDVTIYDAQGKLVYTQKVQPNVATPIKIESSGMYMITLVSKDGQRTSQRIIVTK